MNAWQVTKKDLKLLIRDRRTVFVLVALPLIFITILGASTGQLFNQKEKARRVRLGLVNEDQSELAGKMITQVYKIKALEIVELSSREQAKRLITDGDVDVIVVIGKHYHEKVNELDLADLFFTDEGKLGGNPRNLDIDVEAGSLLANAAQVVQELVFAFALQTIAPDVLEQNDPKFARRLFFQAKREQRQRAHSGEKFAELTEEVPSRGNMVYQLLVPSYTVMFVFFIINLMARSFIAEYDLQTLKRLRIAPISRFGLLAGKTIPFLVISLIQTVLLFVAGKLMFGMWWGAEPVMLLPVMLGTSLAATALGLVVATLVRTDSQVSAYGNFLVLVMAGISGCLMPRSWQPELIQKIGLITPHAWALIAYDQLLNRDAPDFELVWRCIGVLGGFTSAFFLVGFWRFRKLG